MTLAIVGKIQKIGISRWCISTVIFKCHGEEEKRERWYDHYVLKESHNKVGDHQSWKKHLETFHFLAQFLFTISETVLDYYHQEVTARVTSRVAKRLKT